MITAKSLKISRCSISLIGYLLNQKDDNGMVLSYREDRDKFRSAMKEENNVSISDALVKHSFKWLTIIGMLNRMGDNCRNQYKVNVLFFSTDKEVNESNWSELFNRANYSNVKNKKKQYENT